MLVWGVLPMNDLGVCYIIGLHHLHPDEMVQFREVLEFLNLKVSRMLQGEAKCRTRIIADSNPRRDTMQSYVLRAEAIQDLPFFKGSPDVTRWDGFYTTKLGEVDQSLIDNALESPPTIPFDIQRRHVLWAMSRGPKQVKFAEGTLERVNETNARLVRDYASESLPIIHPGSKELVIRYAASLAATVHSTDETHEIVVVQPEHVDQVEQLLRRLFNDNLELDLYVAEEKSRSSLTDEDLQEVLGRLDETDVAMLREVRRGQAQKIGVDDSTVRHHAATLKGLEIIRASLGRGGGYELTPKGVRVIRRLMPTRSPGQGPPALESVNALRNVTVSSESVTKPPQFTVSYGVPSPGDGSGSAETSLGRSDGQTADTRNLQLPFLEMGRCAACGENRALRPDHHDQFLVCGSCFDATSLGGDK